jgi:hypothetical protein
MQMNTDLSRPESKILIIKFSVFINSLFLFWSRLEKQDPEGKADCATYSAEELGRFSSIEALGINLILLINLFFSEKLCYYTFFYCMCFVYESG